LDGVCGRAKGKSVASQPGGSYSCVESLADFRRLASVRNFLPFNFGDPISAAGKKSLRPCQTVCSAPGFDQLYAPIADLDRGDLVAE
jgi:hypothetical protein